MPTDGAGVHTLTPGYLATLGQTIQPSQHNPPLEDISTSLTNRVTRDGSGSMTGNLNLGNNKITGLAAGTSPSDAATVAQATSTPHNRIINGAMQISQERGNATVDSTTLITYTIDQWQTALSVTPGGALRSQRITSLTPELSPFRLRHTVIVTDTGIASGDIYAIQQPIEGAMVADAAMGTAGARPLILRFGVNVSIAGTFGVSVRNSALNRSWVGTFTVTAGEIGTDVVRTFVIPGDVAGTWLTDTGVGMYVAICLAAGGASYAPFVGGWYGVNYLTTSAQTNFMGTGSAIIDLFDVGLYVDKMSSGVAPPYVLTAPNDQLFNCQRYWQQQQAVARFDAAGATRTMETPIYLAPPMRVTPTLSAITGGTAVNCASAVAAVSPTLARFAITSTAGGDAYHFGASINFDARL